MATRGAIAQRDLPRQKSVDTQTGDRLELVHLAASLSEQVTRRQQAARRVEDTCPVIQPFPARRRPSVLRRSAAPVLLALAALIVVVMAMSLTKAPAQPTAPAPTPQVPAAATQPQSPAQALGLAAGRRLQQGGGTVDEFICQAAYNADAQSANELLPTSARAAYITACMSDMSRA